jgi:hypothetical protein
MQIPNEDAIPRAVKNEWFYLIARFCMIIAAVIGMPVCGFMMSRVIAKADQISDQLQDQIVTTRMLSAEVRFRFDGDSKTLSDHEMRMRALERKP